MAKTANGMVGESPEYDRILYVSKDRLASLGKQLKGKKADQITAKDVEGLMYPEDLDDDKLLVPVDVSDKGKDFPTTHEDLLEKLGAKPAVQAMVDAAALFEKNKQKFAEDDRPIPMTVGEWMAQMTVDEDEAGEEEEQEGDEEEDPEEEEDEEDEGEEDKKEEEPAAKKQRKK
eukprot:CAMPEP_0204595082 /NCGR_PEP_ID=MMETSP0661-20131031/52452_1 /ASSEMBLY_ACC=CAM_ASM_000606 /TAXON_ID=109239 /ORGANISM="Alexandrium margalefi, Strain AMGDE01CS-322" /LENGTH=173 /DNA_ID=CAMNT_0051605551 /DNA_START=68 /DNA_END=589 /DNA_ORIENTATION=+